MIKCYKQAHLWVQEIASMKDHSSSYRVVNLYTSLVQNVILLQSYEVEIEALRKTAFGFTWDRWYDLLLLQPKRRNRNICEPPQELITQTATVEVSIEQHLQIQTTNMTPFISLSLFSKIAACRLACGLLSLPKEQFSLTFPLYEWIGTFGCLSKSGRPGIQLLSYVPAWIISLSSWMVFHGWACY